MVGGAAQGAHAPPADAGDEPLVGDLDVDDPIDVGDLLQSLRLGDGPGKSVEEEAFLTVGRCDAVLHHADDDLIGDQLSLVHVGLGLAAQGSALADLGPQHVSGGDMRDAVPCGDPLGLGAFARARRA